MDIPLTQAVLAALAEFGNEKTNGMATSKPKSKAVEETKLVSFLHEETTCLPALNTSKFGDRAQNSRERLGGTPH